MPDEAIPYVSILRDNYPNKIWQMKEEEEEEAAFVKYLIFFFSLFWKLIINIIISIAEMKTKVGQTQIQKRLQPAVKSRSIS